MGLLLRKRKKRPLLRQPKAASSTESLKLLETTFCRCRPKELGQTNGRLHRKLFCARHFPLRPRARLFCAQFFCSAKLAYLRNNAIFLHLTSSSGCACRFSAAAAAGLLVATVVRGLCCRNVVAALIARRPSPPCARWCIVAGSWATQTFQEFP